MSVGPIARVALACSAEQVPGAVRLAEELRLAAARTRVVDAVAVRFFDRDQIGAGRRLREPRELANRLRAHLVVDLDQQSYFVEIIQITT